MVLKEREDWLHFSKIEIKVQNLPKWSLLVKFQQFFFTWLPMQPKLADDLSDFSPFVPYKSFDKGNL